MTTPDPADIAAWRAAIHAAPDRPSRAELVRVWATSLGCTFGTGEGEDHLIHPPTAGLPGPVAGALWHHAVTSCLSLRPPPGGWPPNDKLPEWRRS